MATVFKRAADKKKPGSRWSITYRDENGARRTVKGYTDKRETESLARKLEDEARAVRSGHIDLSQQRIADARKRPIAGHVADYRAAMESRDRDPDHVKRTVAAIQDAIDALGWTTLADINAEAVNEYLADLSRKGLSAVTVNAKRQSIRSLARWAVRNKRLAVDPLTEVDSRNSNGDRRRERRILDTDELGWLFQVTADGPTRGGLTGTDRAMLYRTLSMTGFRRSEAASLRPESFHLSGDDPFVRVASGYSKRRRTDDQPVPEQLAATLTPYIASKARGRRVWPLPDKPFARCLRPDLRAARAAWIMSTPDRAERRQRRASDYLAERDQAGRVFDFHSFRHGFISVVVNSGASMSMAKKLARHSSASMTLGVYAKTRLADERATLTEAFGVVESAARESLAATGTDDASAQRIAQRAADGTGRNVAQPCAMTTGGDASNSGSGAARKSRQGAGVGATRRDRAQSFSKKPPVGLEPTTSRLQITSETPIPASDAGFQGDAQRIAQRASADDPDLDRLIQAWPTLSPSVRRAILAVVDSTRNE